MEAFFWARSVSDHIWISQFPRIRTLLRHKELDLLGAGLLYHLARDMEAWEDSSIPIFIRLRKMGEILSKIGALITIDAELLVLAAAIRWLRHEKIWDVEELIRGRYYTLSFALSAGKNRDVLGVLRTS